MSKINLRDKLSKFSDHWSPKVIAEMNDYQFKLVKIKGDFVWHNHTDTDETFIVIEGEMSIEFKDKTVVSDAKKFPFKLVDKAGKPQIEVEIKGDAKTFSPEEVSQRDETDLTQDEDSLTTKPKPNPTLTLTTNT